MGWKKKVGVKKCHQKVKNGGKKKKSSKNLKKNGGKKKWSKKNKKVK